MLTIDSQSHKATSMGPTSTPRKPKSTFSGKKATHLGQKSAMVKTSLLDAKT